MATPITIKDRGNRKLLLADHAVLMAGLNAAGEPVPMSAPAPNASGQTVVVEGVNQNPQTASISQFLIPVPSPGTAVSIGATASGLFQSVEFYARKDRSTPNTGSIVIGTGQMPANLYRVLAPGESWTITAPPGKAISLNNLSLDADTANDGLVITGIA